MARKKKKSEKKTEKRHRPAVRSFWSGTVSFGLVNVPVNVFPATRSTASGLRMLDEDGTPLSRRFFCPEHNRDVHPEHLLRGYEIGEGEYVIVQDDELEAVAPERTREIDLRRFVDLAEVPPMLFQRPYFLTPAGESNKAYRLLAEVIEQSQRAGIASFVMRGKEYLVAILAEDGILRAETLRFADEIRSADDVGLPQAEGADKKQVSAFAQAIEALTADELDENELRDDTTERLRKLVAAKQKRGEDVYEVVDGEEEEDAEEAAPIDLLETIRSSLQGKAQPSDRNGRRHNGKKADRTAAASKDELYEEAKRLDIPGRSGMTKQQLAAAIRRHG